MPPKVKITKKMVADASFEVVRANGLPERFLNIWAAPHNLCFIHSRP